MHEIFTDRKIEDDYEFKRSIIFSGIARIWNWEVTYLRCSILISFRVFLCHSIQFRRICYDKNSPNT